MKKFILIAASLMVIAAMTYVIPRVQGAHTARPLYGVFDVQMKCMGGHEVFLELAENEAYDNCPGHRDRKKVGRVVRDVNTATVIDLRDEQPWFRIESNGSSHSLVFLKLPDSQSVFGLIPVRGEIHQVTDPWRLWIPRLLPED